ncbi:hypothetical protein ACFLSA_04920, partial [Bacteroidota bacterium]
MNKSNPITMQLKSNHYSILGFFIIVCLYFTSCKSDKKKESSLEDEIEVVDVDENLMTEIQTAKQIFYSLPSPLETAMLIKTAGASFNAEILNPLENVSNYVTNRSMALNLGVYSTDLSYAGLFDQTQFAIQYMDAARKLVDGLGIADAITNETIERLQENINHRDVIMDIISETFMNSSSFLKENNRAAVSSLVLIGGWIEGMYIAIKLSDNIEFDASSGLIERIVDQKLSITYVIKLLEENKDNPDVAAVLTLMYDLKNEFDKIKYTTAPITTEELEGITKLKSASKIKIDEKTFQELSDKINILRSNFIM